MQSIPHKLLSGHLLIALAADPFKTDPTSKVIPQFTVPSKAGMVVVRAGEVSENFRVGDLVYFPPDLAVKHVIFGKEYFIVHQGVIRMMVAKENLTEPLMLEQLSVEDINDMLKRLNEARQKEANGERIMVAGPGQEAIPGMPGMMGQRIDIHG